MNIIPVLLDYLQQHAPEYTWRVLSSNGLLTVNITFEGDMTVYPCSNENVIECGRAGVFVVQSDDLLVIAVGDKTKVTDLFHPDCFREVLDTIKSWSSQ